MRKRAQKSNKQFLIGTATMAFAVGFIVVIFLLMCARHTKQQAVSFKDLYQIEFAKEFVGDSAIVYLNDSLVWNDLVLSDTTQIRIHRFADENTIMVSRSHEDAVSILNIGKKAGRLILHKSNGDVSISAFDW